MKRILLSITLMAFIGMYVNVDGQSQVIIEENFQKWDETEDTDTEDCAGGAVTEYKTTREMELVTSSGTEDIPVYLTMAAIQPECDSRTVYDADPPGSQENTPGVTTGWVQLKKLSADYHANILDSFEYSTDTIGQFVFGPIPQIDSIRFAHSATGSQRGIRIYTSTDGQTWERPTTDEFWDGDDTQAGDVNVVEIDMTDVYIKFTAGFDDDPPHESQYSRLHNITVYGVPGVPPVGIEKTTVPSINIYPISGNERFKVEGGIKSVQVYNMVGNLVNAQFHKGTSTIDLSGVSNGIYIIKAVDLSGNAFVHKVYKQ